MDWAIFVFVSKSHEYYHKLQKRFREMEKRMADVVDLLYASGHEKILVVEDAANTISESSEQITLAARNTKGVNSLIGDAGKIVSLEKEKYASIGAARAGSAGAGFAVVANSIRTLTSESKESAIKIHELIEVTLKAVENGNDKVKETAETLNTIVDI